VGEDPDSYVRANGKEDFQRLLDEARPLSEFLLAELKGRVDMGTLEGRSRLTHEAKPLLKRVVAPALQLQLLKQVAQASGITQEEAGRLTAIRGAAPAASVRAAPARGSDRIMLDLDRRAERELIKCLLAYPPLARDMPVDMIDHSHAEGRALGALAGLEEIEKLTLAVILEAFRGSEHEPVLTRIAGELLEIHLDMDVASAVFSDSINSIRSRSPDPRIKELETKDAAGGLTAPEYEEYRQLIAEHAALKRRRLSPSTML